MRWKIDECPDANGNWTLREDDGTEHGNTETCIATVYGGILEQELIEAAPRLKELVRILREALESVASVALEGDKGRKAKREYEERDSEDTLCAKVRIARAALEATKTEGA